MKFTNILLTLFLLFATTTIFTPTQTYAISLDDDEEDMEDAEEYLQKAKQSASSKNFGKAKEYLKKAKRLGVLQTDVKDTESYVQTSKQEYEARLERERQARLEEERKAEEARKKAQREKERQARLAAQNARSSSSSGYSRRYITDFGMEAPRSDWDSNTVWYRVSIKINDGSLIWAHVQRKNGCYQLLVSSLNSNIGGTCTNCSNSVDMSWTCQAHGGGSFNMRGDQVEATKAIVERSR